MLSFRKPTEDDMQLYFDWTNDEEVRKQSYQSAPVSLETHRQWFHNKLLDPGCTMLLFENENKVPVGQVRFQQEREGRYIIGISVSGAFRGKGLAELMLRQASEHFLAVNPGSEILAYIKATNTGSVKSFERAGFRFSQQLMVENNESILYIKTDKHADS
jgi:RimJ/RimL family protein N-acetyltransferase